VKVVILRNPAKRVDEGYDSYAHFLAGWHHLALSVERLAFNIAFFNLHVFFLFKEQKSEFRN